MPIYLIDPDKQTVEMVSEAEDLTHEKITELLGFSETTWLASPYSNIGGAWIDDIAQLREPHVNFFVAPFLYQVPLGNKALLSTKLEMESLKKAFPILFLKTSLNEKWVEGGDEAKYLLSPSRRWQDDDLTARVVKSGGSSRVH